MRFEITLRVTTPDGELRESEVIVLDKGHDRHEDTGLSIEEGKALLKSLQHQIVEAQAEAFCASKSVCQGCRRHLRKKGTHTIRYRTVFGDIPVTSPRYYRCPCDGRRPETFSPLSELLPTTWAVTIIGTKSCAKAITRTLLQRHRAAPGSGRTWPRRRITAL